MAWNKHEVLTVVAGAASIMSFMGFTLSLPEWFHAIAPVVWFLSTSIVVLCSWGFRNDWRTEKEARKRANLEKTEAVDQAQLDVSRIETQLDDALVERDAARDQRDAALAIKDDLNARAQREHEMRVELQSAKSEVQTLKQLLGEPL